MEEKKHPFYLLYDILINIQLSLVENGRKYLTR